MDMYITIQRKANASVVKTHVCMYVYTYDWMTCIPTSNLNQHKAHMYIYGIFFSKELIRLLLASNQEAEVMW